MPIVTDKCVFLHVPKTGGTWVKHAMTVLGLNPIDMGDQHEHFPHILKYESAEFFEKRFVFAMVRHPITWYQSKWAFRLKHGWQPQHPLDWECASNDFHQFVDNLISFAPTGWCTWLFDAYTNPPRVNGRRSFVNYVGRMENLVEDFITAMKLAGHDINVNKTRAILTTNSSKMDEFDSKDLAKYTPQLYNRVLAVENNAIQRYYRNYPIDPSAHCGPLLY